MLKSKVRTALFLARRPSFYPELLRRLRVNVGRWLLPPAMGRSREIAERWAGERALAPEAALREHFHRSMVPLPEAHPEVWAEADLRAARCPVRMGGGGAVDLLYNLCEALEAKEVLETGVAYGWSSLAILLSVARRGGSLLSVDMPYPGRENEDFVGCVVPSDLRDPWTLIRRPDYVGLPLALRGERSLDLCHYDSDKSYEGRSWSYPRMWKSLRVGGILVSDDIGDNTAFRDFAAEVGREPVVVRSTGGGEAGERFVGLLVKDI